MGLLDDADRYLRARREEANEAAVAAARAEVPFVNDWTRELAEFLRSRSVPALAMYVVQGWGQTPWKKLPTCHVTLWADAWALKGWYRSKGMDHARQVLLRSSGEMFEFPGTAQPRDLRDLERMVYLGMEEGDEQHRLLLRAEPTPCQPLSDHRTGHDQRREDIGVRIVAAVQAGDPLQDGGWVWGARTTR